MKTKVGTLHVGLMKSGTTSVQLALAGERARLLEAGVLYPDLGQVNHILGFIEPLVRDPVAKGRFPEGLDKHLAQTGANWQGQHERLLNACVGSPHDLVLSAENLIYAGARARHEIATSLDVDYVRVVVTVRSLSALVPSNYQQQARIHTLPPFEDWVRTEVARLARGDCAGSLGSLRVDHLVSEWRDVADEVVVYETDGCDSSLRGMWACLVGEVDAPEGQSAQMANQGYSSDFVAALQKFISHHGHLSTIATREIGKTAFRDYRDRGGRADGKLRLLPEFATLLDAAGSAEPLEREQCWARVRRACDSDPLTATIAPSWSDQKIARECLERARTRYRLLEGLRTPFRRLRGAVT